MRLHADPVQLNRQIIEMKRMLRQMATGGETDLERLVGRMGDCAMPPYMACIGGEVSANTMPLLLVTATAEMLGHMIEMAVATIFEDQGQDQAVAEVAAQAAKVALASIAERRKAIMLERAKTLTSTMSTEHANGHSLDPQQHGSIAQAQPDEPTGETTPGGPADLKH